MMKERTMIYSSLKEQQLFKNKQTNVYWYLAFSNVAVAVFPMAPNPTPTAKPSAK